MEGQMLSARSLTVKRERGYTPGAPVTEQELRKKKRPKVPQKTLACKPSSAPSSKQSRAAALQRLSGVIPDIMLGHVLEWLIKGRCQLSVILLSMVNHQLHRALQEDTKTWYRLYLTWRGPVHPTMPGPIKTARGMVTLHPTIPRTLPNFRDLSPSIA